MGNVLVCSNLDVANRLAFDKNVGKLCVTLEGDKVNPSGELSGGNAITLLVMLQKVVCRGCIPQVLPQQVVLP